MENLHCLTNDSIELEHTGSGLLNGKNFVVKDLIAVTGYVSSFGNARWRGTHAASEQTSPIITKLLSEGADLVGTAKLDMLAGSLVGNIGEDEAPVNALYRERFTGGSSSGSASAVAGDAVDFAIGTDTAGSVRVPAAACGLYGLRPTYGSIGKVGVLPWADSFDSVGILSKDFELLSDVFKIIREPHEIAQAPITKLLLPKSTLELASPEAAEAIFTFVHEVAAKLGIQVEDLDFSEQVSQGTGDLFGRIAGRDNWQAHGEWITENSEYLATDLRARMEVAKLRSADPSSEVEADVIARKKFTEAMDKLVAPGTALALPVIHDLPPLRTASPNHLLNYRKMAVRLNAASGLSGLPELVAPAVSKTSGLVYGVGFVGARLQELALIDVLSGPTKSIAGR